MAPISSVFSRKCLIRTSWPSTPVGTRILKTWRISLISGHYNASSKRWAWPWQAKQTRIPAVQRASAWWTRTVTPSSSISTFNNPINQPGTQTIKEIFHCMKWLYAEWDLEYLFENHKQDYAPHFSFTPRWSDWHGLDFFSHLTIKGSMGGWVVACCRPQDLTTDISKIKRKMARVRFELTTKGLWVPCSTTELPRHVHRGQYYYTRAQLSIIWYEVVEKNNKKGK